MIDLLEAVKDTLFIIVRNAGAVVRDLDADKIVALAPGANLHQAAHGRKLQRIVHKVEQDTLDFIAIDHQWRQVGGNINFNLDFEFFSQRQKFSTDTVGY